MLFPEATNIKKSFEIQNVWFYSVPVYKPPNNTVSRNAFPYILH
jgi:hypothetical protein